MKILIVDNNKDTLYLLESLLKSSGYEVVSASNGEEGLRQLEDNHYDVIISDILMPVMDGYEFCQRVKADKKYFKIPFIFYTATYTDPRDEELAKKIGAEIYLHKPMEPGEFLKTIKQLISDVADGKIKPKQKRKRVTVEEEKDVLKLYSERLVKKLENKMLDLEKEVEQRKRAEVDLRKSEEKFRTMFETMVRGVVYQDAEGKITDANPAAEHILGLTLDQMQGRTSMDPRWKAIHEDGSNFSGETHPSMQALKTGKPVHAVTMGIFNPQLNEYRWILVNASPQFKSGQKKPFQVFTTFDDFTEQKKANDALRASEEKYHSVVENSKDAIIIHQNGIIKFVNQAIYELTGFHPAELIGINLIDYIVPEYKQVIVERMTNRMAGKEAISLYEAFLYKKNGTTFPVEVNATTLNFEDEKCALVFIRDITLRKQAEERLLLSLKEKETLLKEIHHRVKNNLQIVMSLLKLQARRVKDSEVIQVIEQNTRRIFSMALVHEELYKSKDFININFNNYIKKITHDLIMTYHLSDRIVINLKLDDITLKIDQAIPCGLLLNEILNNSIKHGFPKQRSGFINVSFKILSGKKYQLTVQDDGIGFPDTINLETADSFGLTLINILTKQIDGSIKLNKKNGTTFKIEFPIV